MSTADTPVARRQWTRHLRGHVLLFESRAWPALGSAAGVRLLTAAAGLEIARLAATAWLRPALPLWVLTPVLLGAAVLAVPVIGRLHPSQLGLRHWRDWDLIEKSYFLQVMSAATVLLLAAVAATSWRAADPGAQLRIVSAGLAPYLFFGFYQELVYRGMVQRELVRRWGGPAGIICANALYTFGPLHTAYFAAPATTAVPMFAAIFLIGLFFGALYHRSGNLWIVACFHGIGNAAMVLGAGSFG